MSFALRWPRQISGLICVGLLAGCFSHSTELFVSGPASPRVRPLAAGDEFLFFSVPEGPSWTFVEVIVPEGATSSSGGETTSIAFEVVGGPPGAFTAANMRQVDGEYELLSLARYSDGWTFSFSGAGLGNRLGFLLVANFSQGVDFRAGMTDAGGSIIGGERRDAPLGGRNASYSIHAVHEGSLVQHGVTVSDDRDDLGAGAHGPGRLEIQEDASSFANTLHIASVEVEAKLAAGTWRVSESGGDGLQERSGELIAAGQASEVSGQLVSSGPSGAVTLQVETRSPSADLQPSFYAVIVDLTEVRDRFAFREEFEVRGPVPTVPPSMSSR